MVNEKERFLNYRVTFIIRLRDNIKPDPDASHSTESGPLSWPIVAQAYNEMFDLDVGSAAVEKRARTWRETWLAARPEYPRQIVYTKGAKGAMGARVKVPYKAKPMKAAQVTNELMTDTYDEDLNAFPLSTQSKSGLRVVAWVPPDDVRNAADIMNYIDNRTPIP